jgi:putative acetyltransferase
MPSTTKIHCRLLANATMRDVGAIAALFTASVHELAAAHYDAAQRTAWAPQPPDLGHWRERLANLQTLVAECGSRMAGFISYAPDGHIDLLFTSPAYARQGIATLLYHRAELALCESGVRHLFTEASLVARPFFERQGFRVTQEQLVDLRGAQFRRFAMSKLLGAAIGREITG